MPLEPLYLHEVDLLLDVIEKADNKQALWNAIATALNKICDEPDTAYARGRQITSSTGTALWLVTLRVQAEDRDWGILWAPDGPDAKFYYVGEWPPID